MLISVLLERSVLERYGLGQGRRLRCGDNDEGLSIFDKKALAVDPYGKLSSRYPQATSFGLSTSKPQGRLDALRFEVGHWSELKDRKDCTLFLSAVFVVAPCKTESEAVSV